MVKTVTVYFNLPGRLDYPFSIPDYFESYKMLSALCKKEGIRMIFARGASHIHELEFSSGWEFINGELQEITSPFKTDLIYNKCIGPTPEGFPETKTINHPDLDDLCFNKLRTYKELPNFVVPSYIITSENWKEVIEAINSETIVLKPVGGEEGKGIFFVKKSKFTESSLPDTEEEYLAQPFIDGTAGIPGLCEGVHDLRIIVFNGIPTLSFIRQAKAGTLVSNISQGATAKIIPIEQVPTSVMNMLKKVDQHLSKFFPRIYTADFMLEHAEKPYIVELNSRPGLPMPSVHGESYTSTFHQSLVNCFKDFLQSL